MAKNEEKNNYNAPKTRKALAEIFELNKIPKPEQLESMVASWGKRKPKKK